MTSQLALFPTNLAPLQSLHYIVHWSEGDEHVEFETMAEARDYRREHREGWNMTIAAEDDEDAEPDAPTP